MYFLLIQPIPEYQDMKLKELFPTFTAIYKALRPRKDARRPLKDRIEELESILCQFLPQGVAIRICAKLFRVEPSFDLQAPHEEATRYWLQRAIADFNYRVKEFCFKYGTPLTDELLERVKKGATVYLPVFLPRLIVN